MPRSTTVDGENYHREREKLLVFQQQSWDNFEKMVIALAAAVLGFSISLVAYLNAAHRALACVGILVASWVSLVMSIGALLVAQPLNIQAYEIELDLLNRRRAEDTPELQQHPNAYAAWSRRCYSVAGALFLLGIILVVVFSALNVL